MANKKIDEIVKIYRDLEYIGSGNSSDCYLVDNENVLLVKNIDDIGYRRKEETLTKLQPKVDSLKEQGVNICKTKEIKYEMGTLYVLQERSKGKTLYKKGADRLKRDSRYKNLSSEELEEKFDEEILESQKIVKGAEIWQIEKYISDYLKMVDEGIFWDSTFENLLYDENKGFSFIDIDDGRKYSREEFMNNEMYIYGDIIKPLIGNVEGRNISDSVKESTKELLEKVISVMKNTEKEDIKFSEDALNRTINLVNEKFDFSINIEGRSKMPEKSKNVREILEPIYKEMTFEKIEKSIDKVKEKDKI